MATEPMTNDAPTVSSWALYIPAVVAAFIVTFFDFVRNRDSSALRKTAFCIKEVAESTGSIAPHVIISLAIFCMVAAILVFVYKPKENKESFLLGMSVLVLAGLSTPPAEIKPVKSAQVSARSVLIGLIPVSASHAQESTPQSLERTVWIIIEGPGQRMIPETRVMVYSGTNGSLIVNSLVNTEFHLTIPPGVSQVEISRFGYRSVTFKINASQPVTAYKVRMSEVNFDALSNFWGPQSLSVSEDVRLSELLGRSMSECKNGKAENAVALVKQSGIRKDKLQRESRQLLCL